MSPYVNVNGHCKNICVRTSQFTALSTAKINQRFRFFKLARTLRFIALSTSRMKWNSLQAVRTLSLSSSTSTASSSMMSFTHCGYSGSTTFKYGHASLFCVMIKAVNMSCMCEWVNKPCQANQLQKQLNAYLEWTYGISDFVVVIRLNHYNLQPTVAKEFSLQV